VALFGGEVDPDRYLYHYTTREAALGSILPQAQIRLGLLEWTNDPRENQQWLVSLSIAGDDGPEAEEFSEIARNADRLIRGSTKLACLTRDDPQGIKMPPHEDFARGWGHSRMWAQYAGGHSGVCLIFARDQLVEAMDRLRGDDHLWHGPVIYTNRSRSEREAWQLSYDAIAEHGIEAVVDAHIQDHWHGIFFVKNEDWAAEWEYRWVLHDRRPGPSFVSIDGALVGVVVGQNFPASDAPLLRHYANALGFPEALGRLVWAYGKPSVHPGVDGNLARL
jgi:hypothetical protein